MRIIENANGTDTYDCFCELLGKDRNPKWKGKGPNRVMIKSKDGHDNCVGDLLNHAATNAYEVFLDAEIDDDADELLVEAWSSTAVSYMYYVYCSTLASFPPLNPITVTHTITLLAPCTRTPTRTLHLRVLIHVVHPKALEDREGPQEEDL